VTDNLLEDLEAVDITLNSAYVLVEKLMRKADRRDRKDKYEHDLDSENAEETSGVGYRKRSKRRRTFRI
jgi:hypothetical protein